jgi:hypothetical protein
MGEEFPVKLQHLTMMLFGLYEPSARQTEGKRSVDDDEDEAPPPVDPEGVRDILKGRRLRRTRRVFRGFDSPPGRF